MIEAVREYIYIVLDGLNKSPTMMCLEEEKTTSNVYLDSPAQLGVCHQSYEFMGMNEEVKEYILYWVSDCLLNKGPTMMC